MVYILLLLVCVAGLAYTILKREHLTVEEVNQKLPPIQKKLETLEDQYKSIQQTMKQQETRAKAATAQAVNLQAALGSKIRS
jgi:hypothetical protein